MWTTVAVRQISKRKMLALGKGSSLFYHKGKLYIGEENGENQIFFAVVPMSRTARLLVRFRLTERLLRLEPRTACCMADGNYLLSCGGGIYCVDMKKNELRKELSLRSGMNNPLSFACYREDTPEEEILFGEYFSNNLQEPVSVYRRKHGQWNKVYSFSAGQVYHIHNIVVDDVAERIYILTGDADNESGIWCTDDGFQTVEPLVHGSQQYRSCVAYPNADGLIYATDTPREQNWLYRLRQKNGEWETIPVCELPGPCIYGTKRNDGWFFATSVEGDDTLPAFRYRFSRKLGKGVQDRYCHVVFCNSSGQTEEVATFQKDALPMLLFQFGNCTFPDAPVDAPVFCTPLSVKRYDGKTVQIKFGE